MSARGPRPPARPFLGRRPPRLAGKRPSWPPIMATTPEHPHRFAVAPRQLRVCLQLLCGNSSGYGQRIGTPPRSLAPRRARPWSSSRRDSVGSHRGLAQEPQKAGTTCHDDQGKAARGPRAACRHRFFCPVQILAGELLRTGRGAVVPWDGHVAGAPARCDLDVRLKQRGRHRPSRHLRSVRGFEYIF